MRRWLEDHITRSSLGYFVMGLIVLSGAVWSFGALVEIGNTATEKANLTTLPVPFAGYLFAGSVDLFIFFGYLKCYGPAWQILLSVFHILFGLTTSLWLQHEHSKGNVDPELVSIIPVLAVAISLDTWVISQLVVWWNDRKLPRRERPPVPVVESAAPAVESGADASSPTTPPDSPETVPVPVRSGTVVKKDEVALRRAFQTGGPEKVEQVRIKRGLDLEVVPERWRQNGTKVGT